MHRFDHYLAAAIVVIFVLAAYSCSLQSSIRVQRDSAVALDRSPHLTTQREKSADTAKHQDAVRLDFKPQTSRAILAELITNQMLADTDSRYSFLLGQLKLSGGTRLAFVQLLALRSIGATDQLSTKIGRLSSKEQIREFHELVYSRAAELLMPEQYQLFLEYENRLPTVNLLARLQLFLSGRGHIATPKQLEILTSVIDSFGAASSSGHRTTADLRASAMGVSEKVLTESMVLNIEKLSILDGRQMSQLKRLADIQKASIEVDLVYDNALISGG